MAKAKPQFTLNRQDVIDVFNNSMSYEILYTFGVPDHNPNDYCNWEAINFTRMAHARLLYDFLETPSAKREKDDVLSEDFDYPAAKLDKLPECDRLRLNKDLMHLTYDRVRRTPATKPWPDSILATLHDPIVKFMQHVEGQSDLFPDPSDLRSWRDLIDDMTSGKQLIIKCSLGPGNRTTYDVSRGCDLPNGKAALTRYGMPLRATAGRVWSASNTSNTT
jgi:hypothetical protein